MGGPARRHTHETEFTEFSCSTDVTVLKLYWSVLMNLTAANGRDRSPDTPSNTPNLYLIPTISNLNMNITAISVLFWQTSHNMSAHDSALLKRNNVVTSILYSFVEMWNVPWKLPQLKKNSPSTAAQYIIWSETQVTPSKWWLQYYSTDMWGWDLFVILSWGMSCH